MKLDTLELGSESLADIVLCRSILPPYMHDLLSILVECQAFLHYNPKTMVVAFFQLSWYVGSVVVSHRNQRKKMDLSSSWK